MKLLIAAAALLLAGPPPAAAPEPAAQGRLPAPALPERSNADPMNIHRDRAGCRSVLRQVQEESKRAEVRRGEARTLDREPSAHLLLAVDRQVDGCREVTFLRRNAAPGATMPDPGEAARR
jgi:hypothetical protein